MRIALSGTHTVGKSTLVADLQRVLKAYKAVDEPFYDLLDGVAFAQTLSVDAFLLQLERSIAAVRTDRSADVLFDRCPVDFLAYLSVLGANDSVRDWLPDADDALKALDLIVYVPIEQPDRIGTLPGAARLRRKVDIIVREILEEDSYGFARPVITVRGSEAERVAQVVSTVQRQGVRSSSRAV